MVEVRVNAGSKVLERVISETGSAKKKGLSKTIRTMVL